MPMTPDVYEEKRNALLVLVENIINNCVDLDEATKQELDVAAEKLRRNSFEIALVGEFQGGKSTTFNTFCGGREISPRGMGIKTSATKISAVSLPESEEEYVDIFWKTDRELLLTMMGFIEGSFNDHPERRKLFYDPKNKDLAVTLQTPGIVDIAKECVAKEWKIYEENPKAYDSKSEGKLDLLQIATLILRFFNNPELENYRVKNKVAVNELQSMVTFPQDWAIRWEQKQNAEFKLDEILFVFLSNAFCHIHSKNLERLGCIITDCPGLFAGPWDTEVAHTAMRNADAILYLIGGQTAIRESDLKALGKIVESKQEHKLFFAINARQSKEHTETQFRPTDCASIRSRGIELDVNDIFIFNARLAFNAKFFPYVADERRWKREVGGDLSNFLNLDAMDPDDMVQIQKFLADLDSLAKVSGLTELVDQIEYSIINKKAEAILVKGGTEKASNALNKLSGDLKSAEDAAQKTKEECEAEAEAARAKLQEFQNEVRGWVENSLGARPLADSLANNFIEEVFIRNSAEIADNITEKIKQMFKRSSTLCGLILDIVQKKLRATFSQDPDFGNEKSKLQKVIGEYVEDSISSVTTPAIVGWGTNIVQENNVTFNASYGIALTDLQRRIRDKWDANYEGGSALLEGLILDDDWSPTITGEYETGDIGDGLNIQSEMLKVLARRVATTIGAVIVGIITAIVVDILIGAILLSLVGLAPALVLLLIGAVASAAGFKEWIDTKLDAGLDKAFRAPLQQKLRDYFNSYETQSMLKENAMEIINEIVDSLKNRCYDSLTKQKQDLEKRVREKLALKEKAMAEQQRVAVECKRIREGQIDPARAEIAEFNSDLMPYFEK